jgi:hypothetical protein
MVRYGVGLSWEPAPHGGTPVMSRGEVGEGGAGPQTAVLLCHWTNAPYGIGAVVTVEGSK